jgi:GDP/UDP-N,N'-diacetylbacillosamine 2-epimerase (hydrolysing)
MRKISVITGTRADYGILKPVLKEIEANAKLKLSVIAVGMHLAPEFGHTIDEIEKDGFQIEARIDALHDEDTGTAMARSIGKSITKIAESFEKIKPEILLLLGDRSEMLAGAVAATYASIPIAHTHGGEISGNVDEPARQAITKLAHIHLAATKESAERIIKMGEEPWRVHVVGAPGLDSALSADLPKPEELAKKYNLNLSEPLILAVQHSVVGEADEAPNQIRQTLNAIVELGFQTVLIYPNADAGGRRMIRIIEHYGSYPFIREFKSLPHEDYLGLMRFAKVIVGNSSSGIIEAPSFGLPAVNIGARQRGRQRAGNTIEVGYDCQEIKKAVQKAVFDKRFRERVKRLKNPYGDGKAGKRIARILDEVKINRELLEKRMTY